MNGYIVIMCIGIISACLISLVLIYLERKKTEQILEEMLKKLDRTLNGDRVEANYDESMDGAISERLNRVVQITKMQKRRAQEERDRMKSLVSNISHQVRTPLANIMLYSGLLGEQEMSEDTRRIADKIQNQSVKLDFFMKELVKSSRAEQEMIQIFTEQVEMLEILNQACQLVEMEALKKNISIQYDEVEVICCADRKWSVEAIGNVIDNAIKYSPMNATIRIKTKVYDSFVGLCIEDEGIGIAEKEQGLIFQRFYRSKEVSNSPGLGIGLYLVREVLEKQGGYVKVNSKLGEGAVFQLFFSRNCI